MRVPPITSAALAWTALGMQWMQMMAASGQAILGRASRTHTAPELFAMGSEKMFAAMESWNAMALRAFMLPGASSPALLGAWARLLSSGVTPYRVRAVRNARAGGRRR